MDVDNVTLPDGNSLPDSPENRRRAFDLWQLDNKGQPEMVNGDLEDDGERVELAEKELAELRQKFEAELEDRRQEDGRREREEQDRKKMVDMEERQTKVERENEQLRYQLMAAENTRLQSEITAAREVQKVRDELVAEREKNGPQRTKTVNAAADDDPMAAELRLKAAIRYSVPLNDPAVDIVTDFANCVPLDDKLRAVNADGIPKMSTPTEFFGKINEKSPDLKKILTEPASGSSLDSRLKQYRIAFHCQKHPDELTMLVMMVRAIEKFCPTETLRLVAILKVAAAQEHEDRCKTICDVKQTGQLPTMAGIRSGVRLAELPGMTELILNPRTEYIDSFEELIMSYLCFTDDVISELAGAEDAWARLMNVDTSDCESMISGEDKLFNVCTRWLDGRELCQNYHRFKHLLSLCPENVKRHHKNLMVSPATKMNERTLISADWPALLGIIRGAWAASNCDIRMTGYLDIKDENTGPIVQDRFPMSYSAMAADKYRQDSAVRPGILKPIQPMEIEKQCSKCPEKFTWSVADQIYQKGEGFPNEPNKCKRCRDKGKLCTTFSETGECSYGGNCRFDHAAPDSDGFVGLKIPDRFAGLRGQGLTPAVKKVDFVNTVNRNP